MTGNKGEVSFILMPWSTEYRSFWTSIFLLWVGHITYSSLGKCKILA